MQLRCGNFVEGQTDVLDIREQCHERSAAASTADRLAGRSVYRSDDAAFRRSDYRAFKVGVGVRDLRLSDGDLGAGLSGIDGSRGHGDSAVAFSSDSVSSSAVDGR